MNDVVFEGSGRIVAQPETTLVLPHLRLLNKRYWAT